MKKLLAKLAAWYLKNKVKGYCISENTVGTFLKVASTQNLPESLPGLPPIVREYIANQPRYDHGWIYGDNWFIEF